MRETSLRNEQEDRLIKKAAAESLVLKRFVPDPRIRSLILTDDSLKRLEEYRRANGLSNKITYEILEELYERSNSKNPDYIKARSSQKAIDRDLLRNMPDEKEDEEDENMEETNAASPSPQSEPDYTGGAYADYDAPIEPTPGTSDFMMDHEEAKGQSGSKRLLSAEPDARRKRVSESETQEDMAKGKPTPIVVKQSESAPRLTSKSKTSKTSLSLMKRQEDYSKVQEIFGQESVDLITKSYAEQIAT